jgi:hypothetical protein
MYCKPYWIVRLLGDSNLRDDWWWIGGCVKQPPSARNGKPCVWPLLSVALNRGTWERRIFSAGWIWSVSFRGVTLTWFEHRLTIHMVFLFSGVGHSKWPGKSMTRMPAWVLVLLLDCTVWVTGPRPLCTWCQDPYYIQHGLLGLESYQLRANVSALRFAYSVHLKWNDSDHCMFILSTDRGRL